MGTHRLETRRSETRKHAGRRHRSTQDGDTGARRTETRGHAGRRHRSTQDGDTGARRTETRGHAGRRRGSTQTQMGPQPAKLRQIKKTPLPYFVPEFSPLRTLQTKGPVAKTTGPRFNVRGAATLRRQQAPRLRQPTHTTSNRCTHRQARHMQQAQRRQAPKRLPAPRRARA